jgi:ubiquinone/menaquinone biosynthesis C-methylase UbiE
MTSNSPPDASSLRQRYDQQYAGDYMDTDGYGVWSREDFGRLKVQQTLRQLPLRPTRVLDYGCGQGGWIGVLSEMFPDANISGVDISDVAIAKARDKFPQSTFAAFDGDHAPFPDASFDLVYTYHVLEHVLDIEASVRDISRLLVDGGSACVIFPCGNVGSLEHRIVSRLHEGIIPSVDGRTVWFYEVQFGHLRRMKSTETISLFEQNGLQLVCDWYCPIFFGAIDFICRGTGPWYINEMFRGKTPANRLSALWLLVMRKALLMTYRLLQKRSLDLTKKRNVPKQVAVRLVKGLAEFADLTLVRLARWEWRTQRTRKAGSAQYLVFQKRQPMCRR